MSQPFHVIIGLAIVDSKESSFCSSMWKGLIMSVCPKTHLYENTLFFSAKMYFVREGVNRGIGYFYKIFCVKIINFSQGEKVYPPHRKFLQKISIFLLAPSPMHCRYSSLSKTRLLVAILQLLHDAWQKYFKCIQFWQK